MHISRSSFVTFRSDREERNDCTDPRRPSLKRLGHLKLNCLNLVGHTVSKAERPYSYRFRIFVCFYFILLSVLQYFEALLHNRPYYFITSVNNMFSFSVKYESFSFYILAIKFCLLLNVRCVC